MATLAEIRTRVAEVLQDPNFTSISSASVNAVINDSLRYFKYRRYWFNEAKTTLSLNIADPLLYGIPSDFLCELEKGGLSIYYSQRYFPLEKIPTEVYDLHNIQGRGRPYVYTYRNQQFEVYFYPDLAYDLILRYLKNYDTLVYDEDQNDFTIYADLMIRYDVLSRIYAEYKQDDKMESYFTAKRNDEERNLLKRSNALTGSGTLTKDSFILK